MMWCGEEKIRTARKPHRCEWCGEYIKVGERHYAWTLSEDREIRTVRKVHKWVLVPI